MNINLKYVLLILGLALIVGLGGIIALAVMGEGIPDVLQNVVVGSLTALAGLLVKADDIPAVSSGGPTTVVTPPADRSDVKHSEEV